MGWLRSIYKDEEIDKERVKFYFDANNKLRVQKIEISFKK